MKKAKVIKNGNLNIINVEIEGKPDKNLDKVDAMIGKLLEGPDYDKYYGDIENAIITWSIDGTKTAGALTREIIQILKGKK